MHRHSGEYLSRVHTGRCCYNKYIRNVLVLPRPKMAPKESNSDHKRTLDKRTLLPTDVAQNKSTIQLAPTS